MGDEFRCMSCIIGNLYRQGFEYHTKSRATYVASALRRGSLELSPKVSANKLARYRLTGLGLELTELPVKARRINCSHIDPDPQVSPTSVVELAQSN